MILNFLLLPRQVRTTPAIQLLFKFLRFLFIYAIDPIVSGRNKNLYEKNFYFS